MPAGSRYLADRYAAIGRALPVAELTLTPTPLSRHALLLDEKRVDLFVKHDERSGELYGGNKVRKLDYLLARARLRGACRIATFGAVGSHHALATALYAKRLGMAATCFLGHQPSTAHVYETLAAHYVNGSELVRFGGSRSTRLKLLRRHLRRDRTWVVPAGGSSWLGAVGCIEAALEFAAQLERSRDLLPTRLYVANGTMGTAAGLALGLALAGLPIEINAVRVTSADYASRDGTYRLMRKTAAMLHRIDAGFPRDLADRSNIRFRDGFVGDGYTRPSGGSGHAIQVARRQLDIELETTYTAKAFAALLADAGSAAAAERLAFWNTYNAQPLPRAGDFKLEQSGLPEDFARYFPSEPAGSES
ncbi:MAG: pyridoxal-phosphate dependent enzyme [Pseudomonadota bacterium]